MCGIAGILKIANSNSEISETILEKMSDTIAHRGPDSNGIYINPSRHLGFSFRRLAIIDLTTEGNQPMSTPNGRYTIVFNGEIYNHPTLRKELLNLGYKYHSKTDTETILYGYQEFGEAILSKMQGMWALAIWDNQERTLFLARDRIGIKPLYYTIVNNTLIFASEIKAILEYPTVKKELNFNELPNYLNYGISSCNASLFKNILKLPSGNYLKVFPNGKIEQTQYWAPLNSNMQFHTKDETSIQADILDLLRESIKDRMMSDVPFGAFLSGGIDSSLNVALMSELMVRPVDTFTVGFKELEKYNELHYARRISDIFKTNHNEILIDSKDSLDILTDMVYHEDEPNSDAVCIPLYYLSKMTRQKGTIVIQVGEGSDEQFVGYKWMRREFNFYNNAWKWYNNLPNFIKNSIFALSKPAFEFSGKYYELEYLRRGTYNEELYWSGLPVVASVQLNKLFTNEYKKLSTIPALYALSLHNEALQQKHDASYLQRMIYLELRQRLAELLLTRVDKMTMAHSLEARVPFLDYRFVEYTMQIPDNLKVSKNIQTKHLLKKAAENVLPKDIIYRPKMGFAAPVIEWLRTSWFEYAKDEILNSYFVKENIFNKSFINLLLYNHKNGKKNHSKEIFSLLMLSLWYKKFF